ncbi:MAG: hypothetical protein IPI95_14605 [Flavobacteriales bacterium]|nr:hypothetical protein [Flavobacteriales bacterium]
MTFDRSFMMRDLVLFLAGTAVVPAMAQLNVNTAMTPAALVQNVLVGGGVVISNVTYNGVAVTVPQDGSGSFTNGNSTNLGLNAGSILRGWPPPYRVRLPISVVILWTQAPIRTSWRHKPGQHHL